MSSADYDVAYCDACERCHLNGICPLTDKAQKVVSMTDAGFVTDPERCPLTEHVDGKSHGWLFWGDDPYVKCDWCGEIRDALTGQVVK